MKSKKSFTAPAPIVVATAPSALDDGVSLVIAFPENPSTVRTIDLSPWLGKGIDPWVWACAGQLRAFLESQDVAPVTVRSYWSGGLRYFSEFLVATGSKVEPQALEPQHIQQFIGWLKDRGGKYSTKKGYYQATKSVLVALARRGVVPENENLFPANPFPGSNSKAGGEIPLSHGERERLALALRDDIVAIHRGTFKGSGSAALTVYVLALAVRTGANLTPLLEASRDCLRPHPFMPNMMLLSLFKRRGNATKLASLRFSREEDGSLPVPMDGVALLRKALKITEPLVAEVKPQHRERVWLYRSGSNNRPGGQVCVMTSTTLQFGITSLIARHDLRADDGEMLRLNLCRGDADGEHRDGVWLAAGQYLGHRSAVHQNHEDERNEPGGLLLPERSSGDAAEGD